MNLLDQLFQYSLRSDTSSISFSALEDEQPSALSSISHPSFAQSALFPTLVNITPTHKDTKNAIFTLNQQKSGVLVDQMETYMRVKDKYRKLSKLVEMFGNKIRKIQYEFLVKLENRYKDTFNFSTTHEKHYFESPKDKIINNINKDISVFVYQKIRLIHVRKEKALMKVAFHSILKISLLKQRFQYFSLSLNSFISNKMQSNKILFINNLKRKRINLARNSPKLINIVSKQVQIKEERPYQPSKLNIEQKINIKLAIVHPQRRQTQNIDIGDNLNMILLMNQELFRNKVSLNEQNQDSVQIKCTALSSRPSKKRSELTNASGTTSQVEEYLKTQTEMGLDQKFSYEVPLFDLSQSACFKQRAQEQLKTYQIAEQDEFLSQFQQINDQTKRFSLEDHQSELNRYVIFRRSIEKRRDSTLKDIQKSKEAIKRIMYELQKTKSQKKNVKLSSKKIIGSNKFSEKKILATQSKPCSPTRQKTIGNKSARASPSKKGVQDLKPKLFSTGENQNSEGPIIYELIELQTPSKNIQVYYNYLKAKRKSVKASECSAKNGSTRDCKQVVLAKNREQYNSGKKKCTSKHQAGVGGLLMITKNADLRERRIDVKVDLAKPLANGRLKAENANGMTKRVKK